MANTYRRGWVGRRMNADSRIAWGTQFLSEGARISILSLLSPLQAIAAQRDQQRAADPAHQAAGALMQSLHQVRFAAMTPVYEREVNDLRIAWNAAHAAGLMVDISSNAESLSPRQRRTKCALAVIITDQHGIVMRDWVNRMDLATHNLVLAAWREVQA